MKNHAFSGQGRFCLICGHRKANHPIVQESPNCPPLFASLEGTCLFAWGVLIVTIISMIVVNEASPCQARKPKTVKISGKLHRKTIEENELPVIRIEFFITEDVHLEVGNSEACRLSLRIPPKLSNALHVFDAEGEMVGGSSKIRFQLYPEIYPPKMVCDAIPERMSNEQYVKVSIVLVPVLVASDKPVQELRDDPSSVSLSDEERKFVQSIVDQVLVLHADDFWLNMTSIER